MVDDARILGIADAAAVYGVKLASGMDLRTFASALKGFTNPVDKLKHVTQHLANPEFVKSVQASPNGATALKQLYAMANQGARPSVGGVKTTVGAAPAAVAAPRPVAAPPAARPTMPVGAMAPRPAGPPVKMAEFGMGVGLPGTPIGINLGSKDERLDGMRRWVPRSMIERVYGHLDSGLDTQAIMELEEERGNLAQPALGAGIGAALARFNLPKAGRSSTALAGLAGGAAGALYHHATKGNRREDAAEAVKGVQKERGFLQGHGRQTASENSPMVVARSGQ